MKQALRRNLGLAAKLLASTALMIWVVSKVDVSAVAARAQNINVGIYLVAVLVLAGLAVPHVLRWQAIMRATGGRMPFRSTLAVLCIGYFFNQSMPSSLGGDAVRVWYVFRHGVTAKLAAAGVIIDRAAGMIGLLFVCLLLFPWYAKLLGEVHATAIAGFSAIVIAVAFAAMMVAEDAWKWAGEGKVARTIRSFIVAARSVFLDWRVGGLAVSLSMLMHLAVGFAAYLIAISLDIPVGYLELGLLFPLVNLSTMLPISLAGWGVREGASVVLLEYIGMRAADAFVLSLFFGLAMLLASLPGGIVWVLYRKRIVHA